MANSGRNGKPFWSPLKGFWSTNPTNPPPKMDQNGDAFLRVGHLEAAFRMYSGMETVGCFMKHRITDFLQLATDKSHSELAHIIQSYFYSVL